MQIQLPLMVHNGNELKKKSIEIAINIGVVYTFVFLYYRLMDCHLFLYVEKKKIGI
jgi:hypothetical protein